MTILSNIYRILIVLFFIVSLLSCKQEANCKKIIYEINEVDQKKLLDILKLHGFNKVIIVADTDYSTETINLCFQEIHDDSYRLKELSNATNRFLKLSDKILIPTISSEDILLTRSEHILNSTGCSFKFRTTIPIDSPKRN